MSNEENGFLTNRDKEFLQAGGDYYTGENAKNQRYETREVIAERARQAFHDFAFLYDVLDERERNRIFNIAPNDQSEWRDFKYSLFDTVAFLYHALEGDAGSEPWIIADRYFAPKFEDVLESGVRRGEDRRRPEDFQGIVNVEFGVDVTSIIGSNVDWGRVIENLAESNVNQISDTDLRVAVALAANPTDRLRELADLIEEERGGRYRDSLDSPSEADELADKAESLSELMGDE